MIGPDVGEVEIDEAFFQHQLDDAGDARVEHLVGQHEGFGKGRALVGDAEQILVGNDDQRIDVLAQALHAGFGNAHAPRALELERLADDADRQRAELRAPPAQ